MAVWSRVAVPALALVLGLLVHGGAAHAQCATLSGSDAQYKPLTVDANGAINVHIRCNDAGGSGGTAAGTPSSTATAVQNPDGSQLGGPLSSVPVTCQAGGSTAITTLAAGAPALVCAASSQPKNGRTMFNITNANAASGVPVFCTWDGSTPSSTSWDFQVYPQAETVFYAPGWVSSGAITCVASAATTIKAQAVQVGAP